MNNEQIPLQELVDKLVEVKVISAHIKWEESDKERLIELYNEVKHRS